MLLWDVFKAAKIQAHIFWVVMPCSVVVGYQHSGGPILLQHYMASAWTKT